MKYKAIYLICSIFPLLSQPSQALEICGDKAQGSILLLHEENVHEVQFQNKKITPNKEGDFMLAFDRDGQLKQSLKILYKNDEQNYPVKNFTFTIEPTKWDIQKINGVLERKVTPKKEDQDEILRENQSLRKAIEENNSKTSYWKQGFQMPLKEYRISGKFGGQRIMNTIKKNPHRGLDMAAPEGTEVMAPSDGKVVMTGKNFFYSGNMIVIDHGQGLHTIYAHLKDIKVKEGQEVKQGEVIATVGKTGRVTGPHLHWGASLHNIRFNPEKLIGLIQKDTCINL